MNNKKIITHLESMSESWKSQFDNPPDPELPLYWHIEAGFLMLNEHPIAPAVAVDLDACSFDVEQLSVVLTNGSHVDVLIDWPFEGLARISEIVTHKVCRIPEPEEVPDHQFSQDFYRKMHEICPSIDPITGEVHEEV